MTIDEYTKKNNLPEMKVLGEMKNFKYYIEKNLSSDEDNGIPMIISENINKHTFTVCDADQALNLMGYFS